MKTPFQRIAGLNIAIVLVLAVGTRLLNWGPGAEGAFRAEMAGALMIHSLLLLMLALSSYPPETRSSYWLSLLLVWLVGFGACSAGAAISL